MAFLSLACLAGWVVLVNVCHSHLVDTFAHVYRAKSRQDLHQEFLSDPVTYLKTVRRQPPFDCGTILHADANPSVEHARRKLLLAVALLPVLVAFGVWSTVSDPIRLPAGIVPIGGFAIALIWGLVILSRPTTIWIRIAAWIGVVSGVMVGIAGIAVAS